MGKMYSNNGAMPKGVGSVLAKNDGEMRVREISNGFIVTESWQEKPKKGKDWGEHKSKDTYYEKNPFK